MLLRKYLLPALCVIGLISHAADSGTVKSFKHAEDLIAEGDYSSAQSVLDSILALPKFEKDTMYARVMVEQSTIYLNIGDRVNAKSAAMKALAKINPDGDQIVNTSLWNNLGIIYNRSDMVDSALYCYTKSLEHARRTSDLSWVATAELNLGVLYYNRKQMDKAEKFFLNAASNAEKSEDGYTQLAALQLLSGAYMDLNKLEAGSKAARQAWDLALESEDPALQLRCIPAMYKSFMKRNMTDSAGYYIALGDRLIEEVPQLGILASGFVSIKINWNMENRNFKSSIPLIRQLQAMQMAPPPNETYLLLAQCYKGMGDFDKAYQMLDSARIWSDSIASIEANKAMVEFNVKYGAMEKELQNRELHNKVMRNEWTILIFVLLFIIVIAVIVALVANRKKMKRRILFQQQEAELSSSRKYIEGMEEERQHFARELHDGIAADMLALRIKIDSEGNPDSAAYADKIRESIRNISHHLMAPEFIDTPLPTVVENYIGMLNHSNNSAGLEINSVADGDFSAIPIHISLEIYRIIQEELSNIIRHSGATHIDIAMTAEKNLLNVSIEHDGTMPPDETRSEAGFGIGNRTMAYRLKSIGATLKRFMQNGVACTALSVPL